MHETILGVGGIEFQGMVEGYQGLFEPIEIGPPR